MFNLINNKKIIIIEQFSFEEKEKKTKEA